MNFCESPSSKQLSNSVFILDIEHDHKVFHCIYPLLSIRLRVSVELNDLVASHNNKSPQISVLTVLEVGSFKSTVVQIKEPLFDDLL